MFGLMRKLVQKPFADTPEKRDHMERLVSEMVNNPELVSKPRLSANKKLADNVAVLVDGVPTMGRPVWRAHSSRDLPKDVIEVAFSNGGTSKVDDGVYFIPLEIGRMRYRDGRCFECTVCKVVAYHTGEYVRRIECKKCEGGGKEIRSKTSRLSDYGWVRMITTYTGAKCPYCKGKGYKLDRLKR